MSGKIYLSFRFHGNFYHSYRGDTPDELGFGKDIRIIRNTIKVLDEFNARGVPVRGTWDFENYFSLERIMPEHCPDIIEGIKRRAQTGIDEIEYMSYNNGLVSASTEAEFDAAISRAITNPQGSGLKDIFGDCVRPIVRPQEMMFTPAHLKHYQKHGIKAISLFYSCIPFNGFSNFVKPLSLVEKHNPMILSYPGLKETMTLIPCYNAGDLIDNLGLRNWLKRIRKQQLKLDKPHDLLLIIDGDADDDFWFGYNIPVLTKFIAAGQGLKGLVGSIQDLDFVEFSTPGEYLDGHEPVGTLTFGQDTADGSFDGYSSWAEKWDNHVLWTGIERSRLFERQAHHLFGIKGRRLDEAEKLIEDAFDSRLKALSTTHFGMSAPVMNLTRLRSAASLVKTAVEKSAKAFEMAKTGIAGEDDLTLIDYERDTARPSRALVRIGFSGNASGVSSNGVHKDTAVYDGSLYFTDTFNPGEIKSYNLLDFKEHRSIRNPVTVGEKKMDNGIVGINFDDSGNVEGISVDNVRYSLGRFINTSITYGKETLEAASWSVSASESNDVLGLKKMASSLVFDSEGLKILEIERQIMLASGLPYIYINVTVRYPKTPDQKYDKGKAKRLQQAWDGNFKELMPCEITPWLSGTSDSPIRVWKNSYFNHVSSYAIDYSRFSRNTQLDSFNNHVTNSWVAVTDGKKGILIAQSIDVSCGMAFCPMRTRLEDGITRIRLNPFGSYDGRQWNYPTAYTGIGKFIAVHLSASDHIKPYAPSYNGKTQEFSLMIAPYQGDCPPEDIQNDALAFSYPYIVVSDNPFIGSPPSRQWEPNI